MSLGILEEADEKQLSDAAEGPSSGSVDNTSQNFNVDSRPTMSLTPARTLAFSSQYPPSDPAVTPRPSRLMRSLLSDDESSSSSSEDDDKSNGSKNEEDDSEVINDISFECELVRPGRPTPNRDGGPRSSQVTEDSRYVQFKRALSEARREQEELEMEEAKAVQEASSREERRIRLAARPSSLATA